MGFCTGAASIRNNTLTAIGGNALYLNGFPVEFENNNFEFNTGLFDVYLDASLTSPGEIQSSNNWWGTTDINLIQQRTWDYYDDYTLAKLLIESPLSSPSQIAPAYVRSITLDPPSPVGIQNVDFIVEFSRPMDISINPKIVASLSSGETWESREPMPTSRSGFGTAVANNGKIYTVGGSSEIGWIGAVEAYDPIIDSWIVCSPMPTPRSSLGLVSSSVGKIYALGGANASTSYLDLVEEYDFVADTWIAKSSMPTARYGFEAVAADNGKIYAIGGRYENGITGIVEEYDPVTDIWTTKTPMPTPRAFFGATLGDNGKIYAIGGVSINLSSLASVEEYDPTLDTWTTKSPMPNPREYIELVSSSHGKIYAAGGWDYSQLFEAYNPFTNSWEVKTFGSYRKTIIWDGINW